MWGRGGGGVKKRFKKNNTLKDEKKTQEFFKTIKLRNLAPQILTKKFLSQNFKIVPFATVLIIMKFDNVYV